MAYTAPSKPGDVHPKISGAKKFLRRYEYGRNPDLGDSDVYTIEFGVALRTWAPKFNAEIDKGRAGPKVPVDGSFNWAVQRQMGLEEGRALVPLVLTCMGHLGNMVGGPDYVAARPLEVREVVQIQMVGGFNNDAIPFQLGPQIAEIHRLLHEPQLQVVNRPWAVSAHSRGAMAFFKYYQERDPNDPIWKMFRGGLAFGNPKRPLNTVAPWILDKPELGTEGLDPNCLTEPVPGVMEVSRHGDLYAEKVKGAKASELKMAILQLVAYGKLFGKDTITEELFSLSLEFGTVVWALFSALTDGIQFMFDMDPHNVFDMNPCTSHLERILA